MTEEQNKNQEVATPEVSNKPKGSKSNLMKYILLGGGGMIVALVVAVLVVFLMGSGNKTAEVTPDDQATTAKEHKITSENENPANSNEDNNLTDSDFTDDMGLSEEDQSAMEKVMDNLAFLDYQPDESEMVDETTQQKIEDSVKEVNWIEEQKTILADRDKELNKRQKDLEKLEKEINQKILRIEQAESARIAKLAKLYDGMDARAVAKLMSNLDDETVVSIIPRMNAKNASAVLQLFPSQRAANLSKRMITIAGN